MEMFARKPKKFLEPVDEWLQNEGYYRKHAPRDATCLFRSVSEQVYHSQSFHLQVRKDCVDYMKNNAHLFKENISIPFENYLDRMSYPTEWGGTMEILAMSQMYGRDVVIYHAQKLSQSKMVDRGHDKVLNFAFTPPNQYDTVFTQEYTSKAAFCQSLAYQILYKGVFEMESVDHTVNKMLHEFRSPLRHEKFFQRTNMENRGQLAVQLYNEANKYNPNTEETRLLAQGIPPFPYRVAKALDPNIYRNVDFDIWHEIKREVRNKGRYNAIGLQPGAQCQVLVSAVEPNNNIQTVKDQNFNDSTKSLVPANHQEAFYNGYIQEVNKAQGSALVFIQELGTKKTVPYNSLRILPFQRRMPRGQNNYWVSRPGQRKNLPPNFNNNVKWRRPVNNNYNYNNNRKMKDHEVTSNFNKVQISSNSKSVTKNVSKVEWSSETKVKNRSMQMKEEKFTSFEEYQVTDKSVEDVRTVLESTKISKVSTIEQKVKDNKNAVPKNPPKNVNDNTLKKRTNVYKKEDFSQEIKKEVAEVKETTQVLLNQDKIRNDHQTSLPRHDNSSDYRSNCSDYRNNSMRSVENFVSYQYEANDSIQGHQTNLPQLQYSPGLPPATQYAYPLPYPPQLPYCPANVYNTEPETYSTQYYPPSPSYIPMTYPNNDASKNSPPRQTCVAPCPAYQTMENYPQFAPMYPAQYIYQPALYTAPSTTNPSMENYCTPYQGPAYFIPFQPMPSNLTNMSPQNSPSL